MIVGVFYPLLVVVQRGTAFAGPDVPHLDQAVVAAADHLGAARDPQGALHRAGVALERSEAAVVGQTPQLDGPVYRPGHHHAAGCRRKLDGPDGAAVAPQHADRLALLHRPDLDGAVLRRGRKQAVVGRDVDGVDVLFVRPPGPQGPRGSQSAAVPFLDGAVGAARQHERRREPLFGRPGARLGPLPGQGQCRHALRMAGKDGCAGERASCGVDLPQARVVVLSGGGEPPARPVAVQGQHRLGVAAQDSDVVQGQRRDQRHVFRVSGHGDERRVGRQELEIEDLTVVGREVFGRR